MKKKVLKGAALTGAALVSCFLMVVLAAHGIEAARSAALDDEYGYLVNEESFQAPVGVSGIQVIKQNVSCGYALIEMLSSWTGGGATEHSLMEEYGRVVTATGSAFCDEMNKRFPAFHTTEFVYQKSSELLEKTYTSLQQGMPVPIEWAALLSEQGKQDSWTVHYSLVVGMDIPHDEVTVLNPYGYEEQITVREFLNRTSFKAFEHKPLWLELGFAFGVFEKNALFIIEKK